MIDPTESLNKSIAMLEQKKLEDFQALKGQLRATGQSLKPGNIIKGAVRDISASGHLKSMLIKTAIGLAAGVVAKKLLSKHGKKSQVHEKNSFFGNALQYGLAYLAANRNQLLKTAGIYVANSLITKIKDRRHKKHHSNGAEHAVS
jgi:hypothetical protein